MADSTEGQTEMEQKQKMSSSEPELHKHDKIIKKSIRIEEGTPRFHLNSETNSHDESETFRKITFGEKDKNKPHKTIMMVGETGTGKTKLINAMINYMLDVQREDKVWFEITDDQSVYPDSAQSQTSIITVYGFYLPESPIDLTVIDTPGYGDRSAENHKEIVMSLLNLSKHEDLVSEVDAVCLVMKATQNRLSERQMYIFDAVQSLFGRDIAENIVLLFTHSTGAHPKNVLTAVKEAKIKSAVNDKNQPVFFLFDNCQGETFPEEYQMIQEQSWNLSFRGMEGFFTFLHNIKPKDLQMTRDVLRLRKKLEAKIAEIQSHVQNEDGEKNEPKQTQEALQENKEQVEENKNTNMKVQVSCSVCEKTCDSDCWWFTPISWWSLMKDNHCTVCHCHFSKHVKGPALYETKTKNEPMKTESSEKDGDVKIGDSASSINKSEEQQQETEEIKLVNEAFHCVTALEEKALNTDSLFTLQHIDFLIEKLKEINDPEKVKTLEEIKKRAGEEKAKKTL